MNAVRLQAEKHLQTPRKVSTGEDCQRRQCRVAHGRRAAAGSLAAGSLMPRAGTQVCDLQAGDSADLLGREMPR